MLHHNQWQFSCIKSWCHFLIILSDQNRMSTNYIHGYLFRFFLFLVMGPRICGQH